MLPLSYLFAPLLLSQTPQPAAGFVFAAPEDFTIRQAAGDDLAHDIYTLTTDDLGRVYVSGPGYIRILHDRDSDGVFETASDFFRGPASGCQGMVHRNSSLFTTSDRGIERYDDKDFDGVADGPPELLLPLSGGEHGAHALRFGPDGALYFLGGNHCGLPRSRVGSSSPVRDYYAGVFCRMDSRAEQIEVWTHGMRNAYDFDFTESGDAFGWDSDSERNEGLKWYRPCRLYHFTPGADCGWRGMGTGELPAGTLESIAPAAEVHRGSPTGVLCYRHGTFPERYRGGIFALDWTFGRVYFFRLSERGASFTAERETFLQAAENVSFAPTDIVASPDGSLLISSGGRGIAGTVYRIAPRKPDVDSRATASSQASGDDSRKKNAGKIRRLLLEGSLRDRRSAIEGAMPLLGTAAGIDLVQPILASANLPDARLRHTGIAALALVPAALLPAPATAIEKLVLGFAIARRTPRGEIARRGVELGLEAVAQTSDSGLLAEAMRLVAASFDRLKLREDPEYFTYDPEWERIDLAPFSELVQRVLAASRKLLEPSGTQAAGPQALEALRVCAKLRDASPATAELAASRLTDSSSAAEDMLHLWCLSQLATRWEPGTRARVVAWAIGLDFKLRREDVGRDEKWSLFQRAIWERLLEKQPELGDEIIASPEFGRAEHLEIVTAGSPSLRSRAALKLIQAPFPTDAVEKRKRLEFLVAHLSSDSLATLAPLLRESAADVQLGSIAIRGLARCPSLEDRDSFIEALADGNPAILRPALDGLARLPVAADPCREAAALLVWAKRIEKDSAREAERKLIAERWLKISGGDLRNAKSWLLERCPDRREDIERALGALVEGEVLVGKLLESVPWASGDAGRGKQVFSVRSCGNCHHLGGIGQRVGPDLAGVGRRLALKELLVELVDPSRNVPERFFFTEYVLSGGEVVQGKEIYSANTSILTVTRDGSFRRLDPREIAEARPQQLSLMPTGLLNGLSSAEIADLMAFLKSQ